MKSLWIKVIYFSPKALHFYKKVILLDLIPGYFRAGIPYFYYEKGIFWLVLWHFRAISNSFQIGFHEMGEKGDFFRKA
jgi:hypothetical protein